MDTNLESALDCLRDIKRKDLHAQKELDSVQKEIAAAREKLRELRQQRKDIATEKTHALIQSFPSALRRYSAGWSLPFFDLLQQRLPRELRDMVYAHVWDKKTLIDTSITMTSIMRDGCSAEPEECQDAMIYDSQAIKSCTHGQVPYFVKPAFTGQESAREMIEAWYSRIHGANPNIAMGVPLDHVPSILQHDRFHVGLKPAAFLRKLAVIIHADELIADLEHDSEKEKLYKLFFDSLLSIEKRLGFVLTLRVKQKHVRLNVWQRILNMCRDVVTILEKDGARVRIQFVYDCVQPSRIPKYNMYSALKYPESDWRQDAVRFFDTATRIKDEHRAYRIENNDDYEPPSYQYDSELDYDSDADIYSNHGESDDSVDEFRRDRHRYYRRYDGWDSERQYGSDFINWKNDLLNQLELEASKDWDYTDESPSPPRWEDVYPEPELRGPPDYDS